MPASRTVQVLMENFEQLDYYELLGVPRTASADEIKRAYRQQIARYHPDRYANVSPPEQAYASQRAQRINEAYRVLSDPRARSAYDRGQPLPANRRTTGNSGGTGFDAARARACPSEAPRDYQAELYELAQSHIKAGRYLQAVATLRQIQQINPFYRDSAVLLAQAEAAVRAGPAATAGAARVVEPESRSGQSERTRRMMVFGGVGAVALTGLVVAVLMLRQSQGISASVPVSTAVPTSAAIAAVPTDAVAPTSTSPTPLPASPTPLPASPTPVPASPTPVPASPTPVPASPTPVPASPTVVQVAEQGAVLIAYNFNAAQGWADVQGNGWSVGPSGGMYRITVQPGIGNIWSYRTVPGGPDFSVGVDVQVQGGAAGLVLNYVDGGNYQAFLIDPLAGSYRLEQYTSGGMRILAEGTSAAIPNGAAAFTRLVARMQGDGMQIFINGALAADLPAGAARTPTYGLVAVASTTPAEALFDNLEVRAVE